MHYSGIALIIVIVLVIVLVILRAERDKAADDIAERVARFDDTEGRLGCFEEICAIMELLQRRKLKPTQQETLSLPAIIEKAAACSRRYIQKQGYEIAQIDAQLALDGTTNWQALRRQRKEHVSQVHEARIDEKRLIGLHERLTESEIEPIALIPRKRLATT